MKQKSLSIVTTIAATLLSTPAIAAKYYNCATQQGCVASQDIRVSSSYAKTRHPLVLAHGIAGFNQIAGVDYFYAIPQDLTANGARVFVSKASSFNASGDIRGEQLLAQVEDIMAISQAQKVN
ncbi:MAG: triacylglycerol lipase, partial [Pseudomonadota bacterium]|nr:triacylglycerol lipase [Pseudomonadota bacterium]